MTETRPVRKTTAKSPRSKSSGKALAMRRAGSGEPRKDILNAALQIFARHSFEGASLQEIANIAGVGQPMIHYYFESKDKLWQATVEYAYGDFFPQFFQDLIAVAVDLEPSDTLKLLIRAFVQFAAKNPLHSQLIVQEMRNPGPRFDWILENYLKPVNGYVDQLIIRAAERRQIKPIPPVYIVNMLLVSCVHFFTIAPLTLKLYDTDPQDEEVVRMHSQYLIEILFNGIGLAAQTASQ